MHGYKLGLSFHVHLLIFFIANGLGLLAIALPCTTGSAAMAIRSCVPAFICYICNTCARTNTRACTHAHSHARTHVRAHPRIRTYTRACAHAHTHTHAHAHTHTHMPTRTTANTHTCTRARTHIGTRSYKKPQSHKYLNTCVAVAFKDLNFLIRKRESRFIASDCTL